MGTISVVVVHKSHRDFLDFVVFELELRRVCEFFVGTASTILERHLTIIFEGFVTIFLNIAIGIHWISINGYSHAKVVILFCRIGGCTLDDERANGALRCQYFDILFKIIVDGFGFVFAILVSIGHGDGVVCQCVITIKKSYSVGYIYTYD